MSTVPAMPAILGGPLADALAAAGSGASERLQQLAAPADDAAAKAAGLAAQAAQVPAAPSAAALDQIASVFSPVQPAATPGSPCGCGDHLPAAFDRATAEQALLAGLGAAAAQAPSMPAGVPSAALVGALQASAEANEALAQSFLGALPAPLRDVLGSGAVLPGEAAAKVLLDGARSAAVAALPGAVPGVPAGAALRDRLASAIAQASDDTIRRAAALLPK